MAATHQDNWGRLFSEMVQAVLNDLSDGKTAALSIIMESEKQRVLSDEPMLFVPEGACPI